MLTIVVVATFLSLTSTVEQWGVLELPLKGPATGNPFHDVDLTATFTHTGNAAHIDYAPPSAPSAPSPKPLLSYDFTEDTKDPVVLAAIKSGATISSDVPAGAGGTSLRFGPTSKHPVLQVPADGSAFTSGLTGLHSFTIAGWISVSSPDMGSGGNRVFNWCKGMGGIDLVWDNDGGGKLKLSVNEWPDSNVHPSSSPGTVRVVNGAHAPTSPDPAPTSSGGTVPTVDADWPRWTFFAVAYTSMNATTANNNNVEFYFGNSVEPATLDAGATNLAYERGPTQASGLPAAFGNFASSGFHADDRVLRGSLFRPQVYDRALTAAEIVSVQMRSGCKPQCGGTSGVYCGSDSCGGSCGTCSGGKICSNITTASTAPSFMTNAAPRGGRRCVLPATLKVNGFYDGNGDYKIRFSPHLTGTWTYTTASNIASAAGLQTSGTFAVVAPTSAWNHGPIDSVGYRLLHADGSDHFSTGSTSYQWMSKGAAMQDATIETMRSGQRGTTRGKPFNKLRMTVFPKWYEYNHANPVQAGAAFPLNQSAANMTTWNCVGESCPQVTLDSFDLTRFNTSFWQNYDRRIQQMQEMGAVADIIVFHPYDGGHWGFDCLGGQNADTYDVSATSVDAFYLKYLAARLSAYSNVWWSMANEWDLVKCKDKTFGKHKTDGGYAPTWDALFKLLGKYDPYGRQTSIHNCQYLYNHSRPWITHVSLQGRMDQTTAIRAQYRKPTIWDEVKYEGDIPSSWGALSGEEETDRFWYGASLGVSVGHAETILRPNVSADEQPLWWAKGGVLIGESPPRIAWFRSLWARTDNDTGSSAGRSPSRPQFGILIPSIESFGNTEGSVANVLTAPDGSYIFLRFLREGTWTIPLPSAASGSEGGAWNATELDYWKMTETPLQGVTANGNSVTVTVEAIPYHVEIKMA